MIISLFERSKGQSTATFIELQILFACFSFYVRCSVMSQMSMVSFFNIQDYWPRLQITWDYRRRWIQSGAWWPEKRGQLHFLCEFRFLQITNCLWSIQALQKCCPCSRRNPWIHRQNNSCGAVVREIHDDFARRPHHFCCSFDGPYLYHSFKTFSQSEGACFSSKMTL